MKVRPVGTKGFVCGQTDGRTDMTKLIVAFRSSKNIVDFNVINI